MVILLSHDIEFYFNTKMHVRMALQNADMQNALNV